MYVEFDQLPETARLWVYISDKKIVGEDLKWLTSATQSFLQKWTAHGNELKSGFEVVSNQILLIGLDEKIADASGCSIDSCVHFIQGMGAHLKVDFFNRKLVPFKDAQNLILHDLSKLKSMLERDEISGDSIIFNALISKKEELENAFIPLKQSWLKTYLKIEDVPA